MQNLLLKLLLWSKLISVPALLLPAVGSPGRKTCLKKKQVRKIVVVPKIPLQTHIAFAADHFLAVVLAGKSLERRLDDTATETEDQVEG